MSVGDGDGDGDYEDISTTRTREHSQLDVGPVIHGFLLLSCYWKNLEHH